MNEVGKSAARTLVALVRPTGEGVEHPTRIGVIVFVEVVQRAEHGGRTLPRGGTVEVGERVTVHGLVQCREVRAPARHLSKSHGSMRSGPPSAGADPGRQTPSGQARGG